jgi:hypothetical protein
MLIRIIMSRGGRCAFDDIFEQVNNDKQWAHLKPTGSDARRAIVASLSHNPPGNFKVCFK